MEHQLKAIFLPLFFGRRKRKGTRLRFKLSIDIDYCLASYNEILLWVKL